MLVQDMSCPICGHKNECHSHVGREDHTPSQGDVALCFQCGGLGVFVGTPEVIGIRLPTPVEGQQFAGDRRLQVAISAWGQMTARRERDRRDGG